MTLNCDDMELVQKYAYLGVTFCNNLSWSTHIQQICVKARKILGLLYQKNCKTYIRSDGSTKTVLGPCEALFGICIPSGVSLHVKRCAASGKGLEICFEHMIQQLSS